jgi:hypothetical protein
MGVTRPEHYAGSAQNPHIPEPRGAESGAPGAPSVPPELDALIKGWSTLPAEMRAAVMSMVRAAKVQR